MNAAEKANIQTWGRAEYPWPKKRFFVAWLSVLIFAVFSIMCAAKGQRTPPSEYEVKAAYLYNFGKFVAWPESGDVGKTQSFEICVLGDDPFGPVLDMAVTGAKISGRNVATKRIAKPEDVDSCRILFISSSEDRHLTEILNALDKTSILTVSDLPSFADRGGMIQFVQDGSRIRFEVNLKNAEDAGLNLSSELLKVALRVTRNPRSAT